MNKNLLYPLEFESIYKEKLWGGKKIKTELGKDFGNLPNCGETWEVSGVKGNISVVKHGVFKGKSLRDMIKDHKGELIGERVYEKFGVDFPLLVKFIDANDDLSVQVHPNDKVAKERHHSFGKTEMWYVMQADPGSSLIIGFNQDLNQEIYLKKFREGKLMDILNREEVVAGDVFFLPAGRVHTIGKGLLIAEIQQASDITYRIYDFDRVDADGKSRELHFEEALDVMDYSKPAKYKIKYEEITNQKQSLVNNEYFHTNKICLTQPFSVNLTIDSFKIYIILEGMVDLEVLGESYSFSKGDVILIPAIFSTYDFRPVGKVSMLETHMPSTYR
ncbi:MAG: type I phosphomannose isomerase catalytic subunit [Bacteroidota bacterium]